jgi:hypothetical protein
MAWTELLAWPDVVEALANSDSWNLEGVKRADLLFAIASTNEQVRACGIELARRITDQRGVEGRDRAQTQ